MTATKTPRSPWWWVLFASGALLVVIGLVAWLCGQIAPDGTTYLRDPDAIILAVIGGAASITALVIPKLKAIETQTCATTEHVVNSHGSRILREDIDELLAHARHHSTRMKFMEDRQEQMAQRQEQQGRDMLGIRDEIGQLRRSEREQWDAIENTGPRRRDKES